MAVFKANLENIVDPMGLFFHKSNIMATVLL